MRNLVILGAGTGGALVANMLSHKLSAREWTITILDKAEQHLYQPGLLFIPFKLYNYYSGADIARPIEHPLPKNVDFVQADVKLIDSAAKTVTSSQCKHPYDWLVCALGCRIVPEEIEGLPEALGKNAYTFYTLDGALALQYALDHMTHGRLVINIAEMPIKCPVAPIEFAFLADYYFHLKGIRERIDITLVTPFSGAFTKPMANKALSKVAQDKNIHIVSNFSTARVDGEHNTLHSYEGKTLDYDLLCIIPPNLGPDVIEESGLGDGTGYALTHPRTLKSRKAENIYIIGDNSNVTTSKAGSVAHFEAETVVENLLREIDGHKPLPSFDGHANCFVETGFHKAMLIDFNYDVEPLPGTFPLPGVGPFNLLQESYMNHAGKIMFDWVYWHMLLPGHLPKVPLLPSHMNFLGKDLSTAPQVRRASEMRVADVMSRNVITVSQGTPLHEAAKVMTERHVSGLPVVDIDAKLIGVLTESDFLSAMDVAAHSAIKDLFETLIKRGRARKTMGSIVDDLMTKNPITLKETDTLQKATEVMERNRIKRLIITDPDNHVIGLISRADLARLFTQK